MCGVGRDSKGDESLKLQCKVSVSQVSCMLESMLMIRVLGSIRICCCSGMNRVISALATDGGQKKVGDPEEIIKTFNREFRAGQLKLLIT